MKQIITSYLKTNIGELIVGVYEDRLCIFDYRFRKQRDQLNKKIANRLNATFREGNHELILKAKIQLEEYLQNKRESFNLPLLLVGEEFEKKVWSELSNISFGKTTTYLELAQKIGNEKAVRAVANANGRNSIAIIIPCHRVVLSCGELGGYSGGTKLKQKLLELEKSNNLF